MPVHSFFPTKVSIKKRLVGLMVYHRRCFFSTLCVALCCLGAHAEGFFVLEGGASAPRSTRGEGLSGYGAWEAKLGWGGVSSSGIGAAGGLTFVFQRTSAVSSFDTIGTGDGWLIEEQVPEYQIKRTMILPEFGIHLRLFPKLPANPIANLSTGPALMIYTSKRYVDDYEETETSKHSGSYWGWHGTVNLGINVVLGESDNSLFALVQYRSCIVTKHEWDSSVRYRQDMSAPAFHIGIQFL
ncbi:MAG: hypothetical protein ACLFSB_05865 [Chitinispirillaceae bacterium]